MRKKGVTLNEGGWRLNGLETVIKSTEGRRARIGLVRGRVLNELDPETQRVMEWIRDQLVITETRLFEHLTTTFRWLMATLFAANGGAILALMDRGANLPGKLYAIGWFALGLIFSVIMGVLSSYVSFKAVMAFSKTRIAIDESLLLGQLTTAPLEEMLKGQEPNWKTWFPSYVGGASFLFFVIGIGTIAGSMLRA